MSVNSKNQMGRGRCGLLALSLISSLATVLWVSPVRAHTQTVMTIKAPAPYNACNVRTAGGTQYSILGTYRNGTTVTLLGESGRGWYRVQVQQITGWVARQCLGL